MSYMSGWLPSGPGRRSIAVLKPPTTRDSIAFGSPVTKRQWAWSTPRCSA